MEGQDDELSGMLGFHPSRRLVTRVPRWQAWKCILVSAIFMQDFQFRARPVITRQLGVQGIVPPRGYHPSGALLRGLREEEGGREGS